MDEKRGTLRSAEIELRAIGFYVDTYVQEKSFCCLFWTRKLPLEAQR